MKSRNARTPLSAADRKRFPIGAKVRWKPGFGVYGYEDCLEADGRLSGVVRGHSNARISCAFVLTRRGGQTINRGVNVESLVLDGVVEQASV